MIGFIEFEYICHNILKTNRMIWLSRLSYFTFRLGTTFHRTRLISWFKSYDGVMICFHHPTCIIQILHGIFIADNRLWIPISYIPLYTIYSLNITAPSLSIVYVYGKGPLYYTASLINCMCNPVSIIFSKQESQCKLSYFITNTCKRMIFMSISRSV